ncbi:DUF58 domain-containing protein [Sphingobium limneticum]|uniref:DUF58 domain-containing protein n=1 Tax=Sphingobium limneticum TaxID=1007511 RepID=A0A5J5I2W2_9SPHN|nr:DUF58 domain-containing protein [Sphingobium limneticum]KAA9015302.1 DUF58 domain-containing protein [Sphingobium limneticum]KAA9029266.1 DUF58 domain-containing protein [Sphingobium limneticum]
MIYPTRTAIFCAAAGVPATLLVALMLPGRWYAALAWPVAVLLACLGDALGGAGPGQARLHLTLPKTASVGASVEGKATVAIPGTPRAQLLLDIGPLLAQDEDGLWIDLTDGKGAAAIPLQTTRRGTARVARGWLRWKGALGLVWKQRILPLDATMAILPDIRPVHDRGAQIFQRHALAGLMAQVDRGDGADFDALVEFRSGMDRRAIDWKQSARHAKLHAKEFRSERNNQIVFAIDAGRQMSEPVAGLPRLDRVVSAMLLTAWVALKLGDRVALHAFDSRPRIASGLVSGAAAFGDLQRLAAQIDYSGDESNYTYALTTLATRLTRRSMIVLFTEFTDLTSAEFLVRAASRLVETHLLLVVVLRDEELESILDRRPASADDVTRAVTAAALLRDRLTVLTRLRHLGAHVIEAEHDRVADRLVQGYVDLKRRNLL